MTVHSVYEDHNEGRSLSPSLFARLGVDDIRDDPSLGFYIYEDFRNSPEAWATTVVNSGFLTFQDTGCTVTPLADVEGGGIRLSIDATGDNDCIEMVGTRGNVGTIGRISDTAGANFLTAWEMSVRFGQVTAQNIYLGLGELANTLDGDMVFSDAGAHTPVDNRIGFRILEADPDGMDAIHAANAGAEVVIDNEAQVIVANTWYKFGGLFDKTKTIWAVDGVQKGLSVLPAATNFPDAAWLQFLIAMKAGGATAHTMDIRMMAFAQRFC